ncbi:MAG: DUF2971 domain-containing protein [Planctomycetota bacterium]|jgi:hypothetical protein
MISACRDYSKVFCATLDATDTMGRRTEQCFGRPRMWAQYGQNHKGVCLVFDRAILDKLVSAAAEAAINNYAGAVLYEARSNSQTASAIELEWNRIQELGAKAAVVEQVEQHRQELFFQKDRDWATENEYRWVIHRWEEGHEYVGYGDALQAVVLGADFPATYLPSVRELAGEVPVLQLHWMGGDFTLIPI